MSSPFVDSREERILDLYWREIRDNRPLTRQEEHELFTRLREGDESALQPLVEANLRFVLKVANEYVRAEGPSILELVAEGNMGLMKAVENFDQNKGFKFITYAVWWIRQSIHRCLAQDRRMIRTPTNRLEDFRALEKGVDQLSQKAGRSVSFDEASERAGMGSARSRGALSAAHRDLSLDAPLSPDGGTLLDTLLADPPDEHPESGFDEMQRDDAIYRSLEKLDRRESMILRSYYGLNAEEPKTLEEIGHEMGVTRERIRQLRNRALSRLQRDHGKSLLEWSAN